jgi:membrane protease YdiL (CAAX protease family)
MGKSSNYLAATRHPYSCFLFLLPLLAGYEWGVMRMGGAHPDDLRNGADAWVRWGLEKANLLDYTWAPPALVAALFFVWGLLRLKDIPNGWLGLLSGMALESMAFALGLWILGRALLPLLDYAKLVQIKTGPFDDSMRQIITYVGAGIYEEIVFRLILMTAINWLLLVVWTPDAWAKFFAIVASALLFSLAHHIGPYGEDFEKRVFIFRLMAGMYFALLFQWRGFGISAGAHACYDVMVGIALW